MASSTTGKTGQSAIIAALAAMIATDSPATSRFERTASTSAPPGTCPNSETRPPMVRTRPISACVQRWVVK